MAKGQHLSPYQRGIVKRYYTHKETLTLAKLQEAISDLYVASSGPTGAKAADRKWAWIGEALAGLGVDSAAVAKIVEGRDLKALAQVVGEFTTGR